jgi:hypothetical protein
MLLHFIHKVITKYTAVLYLTESIFLKEYKKAQNWLQVVLSLCPAAQISSENGVCARTLRVFIHRVLSQSAIIVICTNL